MVASKLAFALGHMGGPDFSVWPPLALAGQPFTLTDLAQAYKAAHLLLTSPFGTELRIKPTGNATSYEEEFDKICLQVGIGGIVAGGCWTSQVSSAGSLVLTPGTGTVAVVNGSLNVTFSTPQTLNAGTVLAFVGAQPGALYALAFNVAASSSGTLTAAYTGVTNAASSWNTGAL